MTRITGKTYGITHEITSKTVRHSLTGKTLSCGYYANNFQGELFD